MEVLSNASSAILSDSIRRADHNVLRCDDTPPSKREQTSPSMGPATHKRFETNELYTHVPSLYELCHGWIHQFDSTEKTERAAKRHKFSRYFSGNIIDLQDPDGNQSDDDVVVVNPKRKASSAVNLFPVHGKRSSLHFPSLNSTPTARLHTDSDDQIKDDGAISKPTKISTVPTNVDGLKISIEHAKQLPDILPPLSIDTPVSDENKSDPIAEALARQNTALTKTKLFQKHQERWKKRSRDHQKQMLARLQECRSRLDDVYAGDGLHDNAYQ